MGGLISSIWKDKEKGLLNPKAFSEIAKEQAKIVDIEGRDFLTKAEKRKPEKEKKNLQRKRVSEKAEKLSYEGWIQDLYNNKWKEEKNKMSQLRKFYDVIFKLNQQARVADEGRWNAILVQLNKQLALVHYAKGRDLVTNSFVEMMDELIRSVEKPFDLQVITDFLEAFMAFYKELRPKN